MAVAARKLNTKLRTFHAIVHVTRIEEWCVEAETTEEARQIDLPVRCGLPRTWSRRRPRAAGLQHRSYAASPR